MKTRQLYESFAGTRGIFGRQPNMLDGMSPAAIAAFLRSDRHSDIMRVGAARLFESEAAGPPLTVGGPTGGPVEGDPVVAEAADDDIDIEQAIIDIMAGDGSDEEKASKIAALFNGGDDHDDADVNLEESASRIHESASRMGRYLRGGHRRDARRMSFIGVAMSE